VARVLTIPEEALATSSPIHYVQLSLASPDGHELSHNFYWLASRRNVFDWKKATYRFTPVQSYQDLTALAALGRISISASANAQANPEGSRVRVMVQNRGATLAFQVHLGIRWKGQGSEILPVTWTENYFALLPGEAREITAQVFSAGALGAKAELVVDGWNVEPLTLSILSTN
jgi:exo-1,4-beta-D-glucosaminidase